VFKINAKIRLQSRTISVRFLVEKVTTGQVFLRVRRFLPDSIIQPLHHTHLHVNIILTSRTNERSLETLNENNVPIYGFIEQKCTLTFFSCLFSRLQTEKFIPRYRSETITHFACGYRRGWRNDGKTIS
jgi:hypothetical protein